MDELVNLADKDGDGAISFAEFARVFAADDIHRMKATLTASGADRDVTAMRQPLGDGTESHLPLRSHKSREFHKPLFRR